MLKATIVVAMSVATMRVGATGDDRGGRLPMRAEGSAGAASWIRDEFETFKAAHNKTYAEDDEAMRFDIFSQHAHRITATAAADAAAGFHQGLHWEGLDRTPEEVAKLNGYRYSEPQGFSSMVMRAAGGGLSSLPSDVDWTKKGAVTDVKQQGQGSSCWSFSSAGAIEGAVAIQGGKPAVSVSNQQIMDCSGVDCLNAQDGTMTKAFHNIINWGGGLDSFADYKYIDTECVSWDALCNPSMLDPRCKYWCPPHKCQNNHTSIAVVTSYQHTKIGNESELTYAIATHGPVAVAMDASPMDFTSYSGGVYSSRQCGSDQESLDHAVLAVGYGTTADGKDYYLVKNSWGTSWGEAGYFRIARNDKNMCGLATDASFPIANPAYSLPTAITSDGDAHDVAPAAEGSTLATVEGSSGTGTIAMDVPNTSTSASTSASTSTALASPPRVDLSAWPPVPRHAVLNLTQGPPAALNFTQYVCRGADALNDCESSAGTGCYNTTHAQGTCLTSGRGKESLVVVCKQTPQGVSVNIVVWIGVTNCTGTPNPFSEMADFCYQSGGGKEFFKYECQP